MSSGLNFHAWWVLPWAVLVAAYGFMGWLDPQHWLPETQPVWRADAPVRALSPKRPAQRVPRPPAPWPDEPAIRQQLNWLGLRLQGWKLGPQRASAQEIRLQFGWLGPLPEGLMMWRHLAQERPQMLLDSISMQFQAPGEWHFEWRGRWQHLPVPDPLPEPPAGPAAQWRGVRVLDASWLNAHQQALWRAGDAGPGLLGLIRPEQLQLVGLVLHPRPQAWVSWQQHTLVLHEGDRMGDQGAVVRTIDARGLHWSQAGRLQLLRPSRIDAFVQEPAP
jgi:hypothetical protein